MTLRLERVPPRTCPACPTCDGSGSEWPRRRDGQADRRYRSPVGPCPACHGSGDAPPREQRWTLHQLPHRHYKFDSSWSSNGMRIAGVTSVLDGGQDALTRWATSTTLQAAEEAHERWYGPDDRSVLPFAKMVACGGSMPEDIRDAKGHTGNLLHGYLAARLCGLEFPGSTVPYGLRMAVEAFIAERQPEAVRDELGLRVERCVGDPERAVGGTYDAQVVMSSGTRPAASWGVHRIDLKQSNTIQPKHFAQIAEYERDAVICGEEESDYLSLLHVDPCGNFTLHSIKVGSPDHTLALAVFDAHLTNHRGVPRLAKLIKSATL